MEAWFGEDTEPVVIDVPISRYPCMVAMQVMNPPGFLEAPDDQDRVFETIIPKGAIALDLQVQELAAELGAAKVVVPAQADSIRAFLAKIGHCLAVAYNRAEGFEPFLPTLILNRDELGLREFVGKWRRILGSGALKHSPSAHETPMHFADLRVHTKDEIQYVVAQIVLFDALGFPGYEVVCGRLITDKVDKH